MYYYSVFVAQDQFLEFCFSLFVIFSVKHVLIMHLHFLEEYKKLTKAF